MLVAQYQTVSQFEVGESAYECGPFAVALNKYAGQHAPSGSAEEVDQYADTLWGRFAHQGDQGIGMLQLFDMLQTASLHYQTIGSTELNVGVNQLNSTVALEWLRKGYPLICSVAETSVYDLDLGGTPYRGWTPSGNHIITLVGISDDGNVLVSDPASVPINERPFPRRYRAADLAFVSIVAVNLPWVQSGNPQTAGVPAGWHDDGKTLTAPNQKQVVLGFRQHVLTNHWDPRNVPLENEHGMAQLEDSNPALGSGTQQIFTWTVLEWNQQHSVLEMWTGQELLKVRQEKAALEQQVQALTQQLAALKTQPHAS